MGVDDDDEFDDESIIDDDDDDDDDDEVWTFDFLLIEAALRNGAVFPQNNIFSRKYCMRAGSIKCEICIQ